MENKFRTDLRKKKWMKRKRKWMKIKFIAICFLGKHRVSYLKKEKLFSYIGDNVLFQPLKLPNEPELIRIGNNVKIAADVTFYTHDVINSVFSNIDETPYCTHLGCIEIHDNVFIGGKSIIIGGVSIGPNAIIGAGSVVTHDVPEGVVVAGNPAVIIGSFDKLHEKRRVLDSNRKQYDTEELWKEFYNKRNI